MHMKKNVDNIANQTATIKPSVTIFPSTITSLVLHLLLA